MSPKSLLMLAAAVLAVTTLSSASGAVVRGSSDVVPMARELGTSAAPVVLSLRGETIGVEDITLRADDGTDQHIVQTGIWSSVKKAAKAAGGTVKKAAGAVKTAGGKVIDAGIKVGSKLPSYAKKAVTTTVKNLTPPVVKKVLSAAKKAAQKVMTPVGKKIAKVIS